MSLFTNPGPVMKAPEGYVDAPAHVNWWDGVFHPACRYCGVESVYESFVSYVENWWENSYEGPVVECDGRVWNPQPMDFETWRYLRSACIA